jgi:hypothetical protein
MGIVHQNCKTCFVSDAHPGITINADGICNMCEYFKGEEGKKALRSVLEVNRLEELKQIAAQIKTEAKEKGLKYDCMIGASGGFDSTYVIYIAAKLLGLKPLVVKYDNGLCHEMANKNLKEACRRLGLDLEIVTVTPNERAYIYYSTRALVNLGVFFTACFSCHYIIASVAYRYAKKHNLSYMLTSTNYVEKTLADSSHGFMLKSLINGFFKAGPAKMLKFLYYELIAQFYFVKLKFEYDGFSRRFLKNLISLHPVKPSFIKKVNISDYVAWDWKVVETILREELGWDTPRHTKVPYFRFDCHYSAVIDKSFKRAAGFSEHALLCNWFVQAGIVSKEVIQDDFAYMNDEARIDKEILKVLDEFDLKDMKI